jgi:8-oxo-dGTP pyrophosphatase MutT (NUDIX family)
LVWLYPKENKIFTRLILRAEYGVHSGQVAFPGGEVEQYDGSFSNTALREAREEVGLASDKIELVGSLTPLYIPPSNFWVHPFIGAGENPVAGVINKAEVQTYFDIDILQLLQPDTKEEKLIKVSTGVTLKTPSYTLDRHIVWGATAMILSELEELIRRCYSF